MEGKVLVTGSSVADRFLQPLVQAGLRVENPHDLLSEQGLAQQLEGAVGYLLGGDEIATAAALKAASALKVVAFLGVGYESFVDASAAKLLGIPVTNTPGTLTQSVAEFTVGQLLNATRKLSIYGKNMRDTAAGIPVSDEDKRHDLAAMGVGIIGLGAIGTRIAEILTNGFGCKVSYWSRTRKPHEEARLGLHYRNLRELLQASEVAILMLPGNESTRGLLDDENISSLPDQAILINTARAEIVEPAALLAGLRSGRLATAVFDGFYDDQVAQRKDLLAFPEDRLIVTRHIASLTHEARDGMAQKAVQSILNILRTGSDSNIVNGVTLTKA